MRKRLDQRQREELVPPQEIHKAYLKETITNAIKGKVVRLHEKVRVQETPFHLI
jgi:hypothetical protein